MLSRKDITSATILHITITNKRVKSELIANDKLIAKNTIQSFYKASKLAIDNLFSVFSDTTNIHVIVEDAVRNTRMECNSRKSAPPEDYYKGLPASNRYIPYKLITFEANGMRYRADSDGNLYAEDNSEHFENIKQSHLRYLFSEYQSDRMNAEDFSRRFNKILDKYR